MFAAQYPSQLLLAIRFSFKEWHGNVYLPLPRLLWDFWIPDSLFSLPICGESKEKNLSLPSAQVPAKFQGQEGLWLRWGRSVAEMAVHLKLAQVAFSDASWGEGRGVGHSFLPAWCLQCRILLQCVDQAVSILHLLLPGVSVLCFLFPRGPWVRKRIHVASYRFRCYSCVLYFSKSQKSKVSDFLLPVKYQNMDGMQDRNIYQGVVKTFISLAGSIDPENHILLQWLYFSYIKWLIWTTFN